MDERVGEVGHGRGLVGSAAVEERLRKEHLVKKGDIVGIIAGTPIGARGTTNLMRLMRIGG